MLNFSLDNFKKVHAITMSDYFKIIHSTYIYLKVTPDTSIRNYNSALIAKTIQTLYKKLWQRINRETRPWTLESPVKISFYIYIEKNNVEFFFIVPERYQDLFREKISEVWGRATISNVDDIPRFSKNATTYEMLYKAEDSLSLSLDKKCNEPLNAIFNVLDIIHESDRLGIFYNFIPTSQRSWRKEHDRTIQRIRNNIPVDREKISLQYISKIILDFFLDVLKELANTITEFLGSKPKQNTTLAEVAITSLMLEDRKKLSTATANKKEATILKTQILVLSESLNKKDSFNNAAAVMGSFDTISNDNELIYRKVKTEFNPTSLRLRNVSDNKMSTDECQNFLELPGRDLLSRYSSVKKVNVLENPVPKELLQGYMSLGTVKVKHQEFNSYLPSDKIYGNLPVTTCGGEGEGKTTFLAGKVYEGWKNKEANVVIDFIKKCELSRKIMKLIPEEDLVIIDCSDNKNLPGLGFNEIVAASNDPCDILDAASMRTEQFQALIDACNDEPLSDQMLKYFLSAANLVNLHPNMSLSKINLCLDNYKKRDEYIKFAEANDVFREELEEEIQTLRELDEINKDGVVIGTKYSSIKFIQNRIIKLKSNRKLKLMYSKSCENNVNLVKAINEKKTILILMPQLHFGSPLSRNIGTTFFVSKLWSTAQIRGALEDDPERVNIVIDELYQSPLAESIIGDTLDQARKFGNRYLFSCHSFRQLRIAPQLKKEGSYMFFHNIDMEDYREFKELLEPYQFEDIKNMKQFHTLNLIKYKGGYSKFVSHLPDTFAHL